MTQFSAEPSLRNHTQTRTLLSKERRITSPMKPLILLKTTTSPFLVSVLLVGLGLWPAPNTFGVSPAPDGGYPGGNTAEGTSALFSDTNGSNNTATGVYALYGNTTGFSNSAIGANALSHNTRGSSNTANGD